MIKKIKKYMSKTALKNMLTGLLVVGLAVAVHSTSAAGNATLTLEPASGSKAINTNFAISIYANGGSEPMSSVKANLTYDPVKLQFLSVDTTGGAFTTCIGPGGSDGAIAIPCTKLGGSVTGKQLVAKISFKTLSGSGSTAVNFSGTSEVKSANDGSNIWNQDASAAVYSLTTPSTPTPTPTPTTPKPTTGSGSSSSGSSSGTKKTTTGSGSSSSGSSSSGSSSAPAANNTPVTPSGSEVTPAAVTNQTVAIYVTDAKGQAVEGAKVTIDEQTVTTDAQGAANFSLATGKYEVKVSSKAGSVTQELTVDGSTPTQKLDLIVKPKLNLLMYIGIVLIVVLLFALFALTKRTLAKKRENTRRFAGAKANVTDFSKKVKTPVHEKEATVITPGSMHTEEVHAQKEEVRPTDTLSEIERKVGANKTHHAPRDNVFEPSMTQVKKPAPPKDPEDQLLRLSILSLGPRPGHLKASRLRNRSRNRQP